MKRKYMTLLCSTFVTLSLLTACGKQPPQEEAPSNQIPIPTEQEQQVSKEQEEKVKEEKSKEELMKQRIDEQDKEITALMEELEYYKDYVKDVTLVLPAEKMEELIEKEWSYSLTINNVSFPKNGILEINQTDFELTALEERVKYSVLPEEESLKGKIQKELSQEIKVNVSSSDKMTKKEDSKDTTNKVIYSFKGLEPNDVIKITLSEGLSSKLGMTTSELEIRIIK